MTARKTSKPKTAVAAVTESPKEIKVGSEAVLIFQAKRPMSVRAFKAAAEMLRAEQQATGLKIVLQPYSLEQE